MILRGKLIIEFFVMKNVDTEIMTPSEAIKIGAIALFGEKILAT